MRSNRLLLLALALCACGPRPAGQTRTEVGAPALDGPDGNVRLDEASVVPTHYVLDLTIDPAAGSLLGHVRVRVALTAPQSELRLHAKGLVLTSAQAESDAGTRPAQVAYGPNGGLALRFAEPLAAGDHTLDLQYTGALTETPDGLYRVQEKDAWYAFTQFEALHARQAFPCFDQPSFKAPFAVTLRVPTGQLALANGPEIGRTEQGALTVFRFAETRPLPTYLVAFAVGVFEVVEAPKGAIPGVPLRLIATPGKGQLAKYALERTPIILAALSDYFGRPYPFAKLDLVAVPNFAAGAMENVGLVTFRETLLLLDEAHAPEHRKLWSQSIIAHELAHMWFGNLVTPRWWDDLWLNESFATWMATRVVQQVAPDLEAQLESVQNTHWVMRFDANENTRAIRQPIENGGDINNAFDGITYGKGARVLRMIEAWIGEDAFREGVRRFMDAHAYGGATTADLLSALASASGLPVAETSRAFLDQPGTPWVSVEVKCAEGQPATLQLSQKRYEVAGTNAPNGEPWAVPMCVRYAIDGAAQGECFVLQGATAQHTLAESGCPAWLHPNADERGYYQWLVPPAALLALVGPQRAQLSLDERVALPGVLALALEAEALTVATYLDALVAMDEPHRLIVSGITDGLAQLYQVAVEPAQEAAFAGLVRRVLGPHAARIGTTSKPGEPVATKLLRPRVLNALAYMGRDEALEAWADATTDAYLDDPESTSVDRLSLALPIAARRGDAARWTALRDAALETEDPLTKVALVGALGSFEDPALLGQSLDLLLDGSLRAQDLRTLMRGVSAPEPRDAAWRWLTEHYDAVAAQIGQAAAPNLVWVGAGFCDADRRAAVADFFGQPAHAPEGTARNLGLVLEGIDRCVRQRAWMQPALHSWLASEKFAAVGE